jgi:hypothetical protein
MERIGGGFDISIDNPRLNIDTLNHSNISDSSKTEEHKSLYNINNRSLLQEPIEESKSDTSLDTQSVLNNDMFTGLALDFRSNDSMLPIPNRDNIEERMRVLRRNFESYNNDSSSDSSESSIQPLSTCSKLDQEDVNTDYNLIDPEEVRTLLQCTICYHQMSEMNHLM